MHSSRVLAKSRQAIEFLYGPSEYLALGVIEGASWHGKGANGEQEAFVALPPQDIKAGDVALSKVPFLAMRNDQKLSRAKAYDGLLPTGLFRRVFISHSGEFAVLEPRF